MINVIKNIFLYTLVAASVLVFAQQKATGVGYGLTKDAAVEQAKRDAVEQGLGAYRTSTTTVTATFVASSTGVTQYYDLQYKIGSGGTWANLVDGQAIAAGETKTHTSPSVSDGSTIYFQYRIGDSNPSSGSYGTTGTGSGTLSSQTIDCSQPVTLTVSQSLGTCSAAGGTRTSTLSIAREIAFDPAGIELGVPTAILTSSVPEPDPPAVKINFFTLDEAPSPMLTE